MKVVKRVILLTSLVLGLAALVTPLGGAATVVGPIDFEPPAYTVGNINGQQGWMKTGPYDVEVEATADYPAASGYGFALQALRLSNAITTGGFGDQTFSPAISSPAGEGAANHFDATYSIGTALATWQTGLSMSVSPDDGNGSRVTYLRFEDHADGVRVFFVDVTNPGPLPTVSTFNEYQVATLNRTSAHSIGFSVDFRNGPANDVVKIYVDSALVHTGTTWEDYYRYDPEQIGNVNQVPDISKMLFRLAGTAMPLNLGNGYLVDGLTLESSTLIGPPTSKEQCKNGGWRNFNNPTFRNQGDCVSYFNHQ